MGTDRQAATRRATPGPGRLATLLLAVCLGLTACTDDTAPSTVEVVGTTLDGETLALADGDGPVVVNFWASWCGPCRREAPALNAAAEEWADRGVRVVGVNARDTAANAQVFADEHALVFPSLFDPDQRVAAAFGADAPAALPTTLVLDGRRRVVVRLPGEVDTARLDEAIARVLDGEAAAAAPGRVP